MLFSVHLPKDNMLQLERIVSMDIKGLSWNSSRTLRLLPG